MRLNVENITKSFDDKVVLNNISFSIGGGEIVALIGRNGSGKTTILKIISQIFAPDSGKILIDNEDLSVVDSLKSNIGYLPDNFNFFPYDKGKKVLDYYAIVYDNFDRDFVFSEMKKLNISMDTNVRNLSKGQKTLLGLVIILATNAPFLLVDEVLDGMDVLNKETIINYLLDAAESGRSILVSSHQLAELEGIADRVYYLSLDGSIEQTTDSQVNILKYQVVVKDKLPKPIEDLAVIKESIARVYTILVDGDEKQWDQLLTRPEIIQYDKLQVHLEDLFFYESGKEK